MKAILINLPKLIAMVKELQSRQIESLLERESVGRLACHYDGETYLLPISYVYDNNYIYCLSREGKKINIMRKNPKVAFEVDDIRDISNWQSVVVRGSFEEVLGKEERVLVLHKLLSRFQPILSTIRAELGNDWPFCDDKDDHSGIIMFRIAIREKTGRFDSEYQPDSLIG